MMGSCSVFEGVAGVLALGSLYCQIARDPTQAQKQFPVLV